VTTERLRALPSVDVLLQSCDDLVAQVGREAVVMAIRTTLDTARQRLLDGESVNTGESVLISQVEAYIHKQFQPTLRPVINATGVIIHTNLGRAPLSEAAQRAVQQIAAAYNTLEFNLDTGKRGSRLLHAEAILMEITGAEAALVVNNNAAATVLMLAGLAQGHEVIVSRGQLVEIGGGFRVPDIMVQSGAQLVEVGTTNRTRTGDYQNAITEQTALLMRVHASNFKQVGFTEQPPLGELAELAHTHGLYLVDDLGSGALIDTAQYGLDHEPTVQESLAAGCDVVAFSGDKLLGGPQAGILVGKRDLIDQLKRHPLARAIRADKLCLAALTATLNHYRHGEAIEKIPVLHAIAKPLSEIEATAERWQSHIGNAATVIDGDTTVGGGSLPGATLPTKLVALNVPRADAFMVQLRQCNPPIIARVQQGQVVFDPRTVLQGQEHDLMLGITNAKKSHEVSL